ncbi:active regulator of SIRT1-like [Diorhabda sublineata]|uniref:active regulator of SIRT1-like n=1 Tax=Diorhabda sublineata TaxID=1163346 RepID=UPI0024E05B8E|nr:active regulator of SIRT1-like [Diorhabda sublineata]
MSASLVRKGLQIVDPQYDKPNKRKKKSDVFTLAPQNHKLIKKVQKQGKEFKINLLSTEKKLTVTEARKNNKSKEQLLEENLRKLKRIKKASRVQLDKNLVKQIIDRAVNKRPIRKIKPKTEKKTAFTEEDFKKFEEEYLN